MVRGSPDLRDVSTTWSSFSATKLYRRAVPIEPGTDLSHGASRSTNDSRKRDKSAKGFYFNVEIPQKQYELKHPEIWRSARDGR